MGRKSNNEICDEKISSLKELNEQLKRESEMLRRILEMMLDEKGY